MVNFAGMEFLFFFLPIILICYYVFPVKYRDEVLLVGSFVFYALGEPLYVLLFLLLTFVNFFIGKKIWNCQDKSGTGGVKRKQLLAGMVSLDVAILIVFKLMNVFYSQVALPLGISFYLFKMISWQVDLYRGRMQEMPSLKHTALYFSLFPQVVSGPIMRYEEGVRAEYRNHSLSQIEEGISYFVAGLGMKVLLADRLAILWNDLRTIGFQSISTPLAWLGACGYSLQLYFDFWGYSLMASGMLMLFGFRFIENFHHPYAADSISDFYRRWHMTLGRFFRDYVYIPMGGSRRGKGRLIFALTVVWLLTGLWHGSGWNYLIWGGALGVLILLEKLFYGEKLRKVPVLRHVYVCVLIALTWVIFAITDLRELWIYFGRLFPVFGGSGIAVSRGDVFRYLQTYGRLLIVGILLCIPGVFDFFRKHLKHPLVVLLLLFTFWYAVYYIVNSGANPFLYFKF